MGLQVYNPDGTLVGTVQDVILPIGEEGGEISLQIITKYNQTESVKWSEVEAVGDIVILKNKIELKAPEGQQPTAAPQPSQPTPQPVSPQPYVATPPTPQPPQQQKGIGGIASKLGFGKKEENRCPTCGSPLTYIEQYQRWYCYNEGKYV